MHGVNNFFKNIWNTLLLRMR